ncbi:TolC family protein [Aquimarina brevivitae]|uniref:Outer membrane protein TolC n=1 Tax=Aquimarina brevivitae TaxID=323412 RepID=A0A4V2F789_9FLAO|nr:TolC family protein [Aquimarina brevivitae]RZS98979.1 outer membrane protein TolC [Aquimarina brevivitae]
MRNPMWSILIGLLVTSLLQAQDSPAKATYSFSLEEAITYALENSYEAINARRDVAKALKRKWETTADGLPQINGALDYTNQLKQPVTPLPGEVAGGEPGTFVPVVFAPQQQMQLTATLSQLIFDGSYLVGLEAAKSFLQYTDDVEEKTRLDVRRGVINAYGSVLVAQELVSILTENKNTLDKNYQETKLIFENGLAEEEDVEQLQITLLQITNQLENAQRQAKIALQMFNLTVGIEVGAETVLTDDLDQLTMQNLDKSVTTKPFVLENNVNYRLAELLTEQRRLEMKLEKSRALPSISAFINYGTTAFNNDFVFLESETRWFQSSVLGASLKVPIFSSLRRSARTQQAKIALEQSRTELRKAEEQIQLQYDKASSDFKQAIDNYEAAKKNLALAERIENKNQIKYTEGLASSFDLRQAQLQLYSSQQQVLQAKLSIINNKAALETILNLPDVSPTDK